ncbi:MAG: MoaD/ThiS family protein [Candidatus Ranarchaeia archaeon]
MEKEVLPSTTEHNTISDRKAMIVVRIKFIGALREALGTPLAEVELPRGTTLKEALIRFAEIYGKPFEEEVIDLKLMRLQPFINIMINGQNAIRMKGLQTVLKDQDELLMIPPITGGDIARPHIGSAFNSEPLRTLTM